MLKFNPDPKLGPERLAHLKASEYVDYGYISKDDFSEYFKFSFVRNPWERIVSEYRFRNHEKKMSFRKYVLKGLPMADEYSDDYRHIIPQYDYLYDERGDCLVDFIGRFERLQNDFDLVCRRLHIRNSQLPHVNSSTNGGRKNAMSAIVRFMRRPRKPHYSEFYDSATKLVVEKMYRKDIDLFSYSFETLSRRSK